MVPPPRWKPRGCWARFTPPLAILNSSPATAVLEKEAQRMCFPPTLLWAVGSSENWRKKLREKKEVCEFLPASLLCVWEHYPCGHYSPNSHFSYWTDHLIWLQRWWRRILRVKQENKSEQHVQLKSQGKKLIMAVVIFTKLLWKMM